MSKVTSKKYIMKIKNSINSLDLRSQIILTKPGSLVRRQGWKMEVKAMLGCFLGLALQGLSPLLCFFHKLSPNLAGKVEVCGLCQLDCEIEGLPILSQRKSPLLEDGPRVSNTSHLAKWPWKWRCLWAEMVIGNSWQRGNSEAMCLPRDVSDCI